MAANHLTVGACLLLTLANIPTQATNSRFTTMPISALDKAMLGVDPILSNPLGESDPGLKHEIFVPSKSVGTHRETIELNSFIGKAVQDVRCDRVSSSSMTIVSSFDSYKNMMSKSVSFKAGGGISAKYNGFGGGVHVGYGSGLDTSDEKYQEFFRETEGEIVLGGAECQTHVVTMSLSTKPVFTENFLEGLRKLNLASQNPQAENSVRAFKDFVENFGTHYQDTTIFGSKLVIEKLFSRKAASAAESTNRTRCVSSSFSSSFEVNAQFVKVQQTFREKAKKCSGSQSSSDAFDSLGLSSERIITIGTAPYSDPDQWAEHTLQTPVPIHYTLEKISRMFTMKWFDDYVPGEKFNGTVMRAFFENHSRNYCTIMNGRPCTATCGNKRNCNLEERCVRDNTTAGGFKCYKGCGVTSDCGSHQVCYNVDTRRGFRCVDLCSSWLNSCSPGETCHAEPHSATGFICVPTKPGRAVVAGGYGRIGGNDTTLAEVESLNYKTFPDLPRPVRFNAISRAGDYLYTCGGWREDSEGDYATDDCYRINVHTPGNEWKDMRPVPIDSLGPAVTVGDTLIWFFGGSTLGKFDTERKKFTRATLPFDSNGLYCAVSNGTHVYVIGAGIDSNEIWTNTNAMDETEWELAGHLMRSRYYHACLWYGSNIMITGGYDGRSDVELFNTETREVWAGKEMLKGLQGHKMMLHNGMPSVVGGYNGNFTSRITSYSITDDKWIASSVKLNNPNAHFALVEV